MQLLEVEVLEPDRVKLLREELATYLLRDPTIENKSDEWGRVSNRIKVWETPLAVETATAILGDPRIRPAIAEYTDYAWRMFYNEYAGYFEVGMSRYPAGGFYRWHADHQPLDRPRILTFVLFLTEGYGGDLELSTDYLSPDKRSNDGFDVQAECAVSPRIGHMVMFPAQYPHRVLPSTGNREVLHGHVCLGPLK